MSPAVEEALIDIELSVWFLQLSIEGDNYARERLSGFALDNFRDACLVCGVLDDANVNGVSDDASGDVS